MGETKIMDLKPARLYEMQELEAESIRIGDLIPAIVRSADAHKQMAYVSISKNVDGFIRLENFSYPSKHDDISTSKNKVGKDVTGYISKEVIGKVIDIHEDGLIELDRRQVLEYATNTLANNVGGIVTATVETINPYGIFVDIGNGVHTLIHVTECSTRRYDHIEKFFTIEEVLPKVKILSFDPESKLFRASIKQAYERHEFQKESVARVKVCGFLDGGAFVEFNPATTGIMDIFPSERQKIEEGSYVLCRIKKNASKGFKAYFVSLI